MMSARSSIYDYVEENGRTYHRYKEGSMLSPSSLKGSWLTRVTEYMLPNDEVSILYCLTERLLTKISVRARSSG